MNNLDLQAIRNTNLGGLGTLATAATFRLNLDGNDRINALDVNAFRGALIRPLGIAIGGLTAPTEPEPAGQSDPQSTGLSATGLSATGLSATGLSAEAWAWFAIEQEQKDPKKR
jgi:hypothetical protein